MGLASTLFGLALVIAPTVASAAEVTVTLSGVKAKGGTMRVSLYDEGTFLKAHPPFLAEAKVADAGTVTVSFKNVPPGDYAVAALHDANDDERMEMIDGRLSEGTALSNAEKLRGAPTFAVTKVAIAGGGATMTLPMSYPEDRQGW